MSQEQPPIRSRRELRKARDAQQASMPSGADQLSPAPQQAAAPPVPGAPSAASDQAATQRSSQIRARDRAALRAIKELEEKEGQLSAGGPPTRRQLRLQQLKEQALTAASPIVPPASAPQPSAGESRNGAGKSDNGEAQLPDTRKAVPGEGTRQGASTPTAVDQDSAAAGGMTVEQALAARTLLAEQAKNQIAKMEHIASRDPEAVDPEILAEQIALAERAAVLNRRAMARQKLAEQAGTPPAAPKDPGQGAARDADTKERPGKPESTPGQRPAPSTANNLAMVTPLEFVQVPGVDRPVMKPPATSHVPVTTRPVTKVTPAGTKKRRTPAPQRTAAADAPGRSEVIARAEVGARTAAEPRQVITDDRQGEELFDDLPRIPARSAYGLDPLDAATAGLARANRNRILQFCILAFGIVALVSGIILIISGMSR